MGQQYWLSATGSDITVQSCINTYTLMPDQGGFSATNVVSATFTVPAPAMDGIAISCFVEPQDTTITREGGAWWQSHIAYEITAVNGDVNHALFFVRVNTDGVILGNMFSGTDDHFPDNSEHFRVPHRSPTDVHFKDETGLWTAPQHNISHVDGASPARPPAHADTAMTANEWDQYWRLGVVFWQVNMNTHTSGLSNTYQTGGSKRAVGSVYVDTFNRPSRRGTENTNWKHYMHRITINNR
jgi:hypothetical protein